MTSPHRVLVLPDDAFRMSGLETSSYVGIAGFSAVHLKLWGSHVYLTCPSLKLP